MIKLLVSRNPLHNSICCVVVKHKQNYWHQEVYLLMERMEANLNSIQIHVSEIEIKNETNSIETSLQDNCTLNY